MKSIFAILLCAIGLTGCTTMRKVEALQASDKAPTGVRVQLGSADRVVAGEQVRFYSFTCKIKKMGSMEPREYCDKIQMGDGEVAEVLGENTSLVQPNPGVKITQGMYVEKKNK